MSAAKIRLHVEHELGAGQSLPLTREQAHYLFGVMRLGAGGQILLFNGRDGEWRAEVMEAGKRGGVLMCREQTRPLRPRPDLWLLFAPIKKARTDFIVEKATELGAARILPVQTDFTNAERVRRDRLQAHALEAAEQCGATSVPEVGDLGKLSKFLDGWGDERQIMFCDEMMADATATPTGAFGGAGLGGGIGLPGPRGAPWAVLIGPEGGFSPDERARLRGMACAHGVRLGPRILRADTAAVAALTLWQQALGDWDHG